VLENDHEVKAPVLRVLMINYEFPPIGGGTGMACSQLLAQFAGRTDIVVDLVTSGMGTQPYADDQFADNIIVHRLPVAKRDLYYWRAGELFSWTRQAIPYASRLSRRCRYDVCHCWSGWPSGIVGYWLRRRIPYIVSLRGSDVPGYSKRLRLLDLLLMRHVSRRVWGQAARVVAVSRNLRALALQTQPKAVIDIIPNGVDAERFTPGSGQDNHRVLFVGRLVERKGVHVLLEAFRGVVATVPDAVLTIVGDGPERARLEAMVGNFEIGGQVVFRGHLAGAEIPGAYRENAILVLPALADAMPNVVLEAMAAGLAIVTTPTGGSAVIHGNGVTVPPADPDALREALVAYLADPARLAQHRSVSRRLAEGMSWTAVAEFCLELYREAVTAGVEPVAAAPREFRLSPH
jgi:glycosyltransferase involved in cell wall biosynthesis